MYGLTELSSTSETGLSGAHALLRKSGACAEPFRDAFEKSTSGMC